MSTTFNSRNSLYFNRLDPKYGAQLDFNYVKTAPCSPPVSKNRILQSQGITACGTL
ncbi:MAG: hypothetical protein IPH78_11915 [Bacteroidetes bacterium]|nr:hypothetical protein [Bacteroidota bacterium]